MKMRALSIFVTLAILCAATPFPVFGQEASQPQYISGTDCTVNASDSIIAEDFIEISIDNSVNKASSDNTSDDSTFPASIGTTTYPTVEAAIADANDNDIVKLSAGTFEPINLSGKSITLEGTMDDEGNLLTEIKGGDIGLTLHRFNGTIKNLKISESFRGAYGEPAGTISFENVSITGATYGLHLIAYSDNVMWTVKNCYMDISWANSLSNYNCDYPTIVIENNVFTSTSPYYPEDGTPVVNTFSPYTTISNNVFGENARIYIRTEAAAEGVAIGTNYYADGAENALLADDGGYVVSVPSCYESADMKTVVNATVRNGDYLGFSISDALATAKDGDVIEVASGTYSAFNVGEYTAPLNNITIKGTDLNNKPVIIISDVNDGGIKYQGSGIAFENLEFVVEEFCSDARTWNVSALGYYYENVGISREGLTVKNCDFINNSNIEMSAIAANLSSYSVEGCSFTNFATGIHSYMDNSIIENVSIKDNSYLDVDTLVNVYYGGAAAGTSALTIAGNKSSDGSATKISVDNYAKVNDISSTAYDVLNVFDNDATVIIHNHKKGDCSEDFSSNTMVIYNYTTKQIADECASEGDEFYFNYGKNTQTKAEMTADGIVYTELSSGTGKAAFSDGTYYDTISEAIAAADSNATLELLSDAEISGNEAAEMLAKNAVISVNEFELTITGETEYPELINVPARYKLKEKRVVGEDGSTAAFVYTITRKTIARPSGTVVNSGNHTAEEPPADADEESVQGGQIILTIGEKTAIVFGVKKENDVAPKIVNGRTMLPARFVAENLGAEVIWSADEPDKVLIVKDDIEIIIFIGSDKAYVNGKEVILDSPAFIENDRTYTPIRFISEELGADVEWCPEEEQVVITPILQETDTDI